MKDITVIHLKDTNDADYDCIFTVDKAKYIAIKKDLGQLMTATEESEVPQNDLIPQDVAMAYFNEDISWYNCLYQIFDNIAVEVETIEMYA